MTETSIYELARLKSASITMAAIVSAKGRMDPREARLKHRREHRAEVRKEHPEAIRKEKERKHEYYLEHAENIKARTKAYRDAKRDKKDPEFLRKACERVKRYRARIMQDPARHERMLAHRREKWKERRQKELQLERTSAQQ